MLKQTITFKDLEGKLVTEDFYFNLSTVELAEMGFGDEGLADRMKKIIETEDTAKIFEMFKLILTKAVGRKSDDNRRFIKNQEVIDDFFQSNAYEELFLEWIADANKAAQFINGIVPDNLDETIAKIGARQKELEEAEKQENNDPQLPDWYTENRIPTEAEIKALNNPELLKEAFRRKSAQS